MSDGPWEEITAAIVSVIGGIGGVLGWQRYKRPAEKPAEASSASSGGRTGATTVRLETVTEKIEKADARITRLSDSLFQKVEALEREIAKVPALEDRLNMVQARLIESEDKVNELRADVAVLKDRTAR